MSEKADVKSSRMQKGCKTINYLQKLKDEGTPIVQMCPGPRDQFWTMAAEMADVDICCLTVPGDGSDPEMQIKLAPYWIKCVRNAAKIIHINFYMQTPTYASKEAAVANGALYMNCGADSLLPMGSGLGLYIVKTIINLHNAEVSVQNTDDGVSIKVIF